MDNYIDQYGRYHDKPVTETNPIPSNNGWIYTAYAQKAGLEIDDYKLRYCAELCDQGYGVLWRTPGKEMPPMSRDEVLGMIALGVMDIPKDWSFSPFPIPKFSLVSLAKQLWQLRPQWEQTSELFYPQLKMKHRNYFWQNNLDQIYRFAFSVPLVDRHYILSKKNKFNIFYWAIAKADSLLGKDSGIRYLKYDKGLKAMQSEFPETHPIHNV